MWLLTNKLKMHLHVPTQKQNKKTLNNCLVSLQLDFRHCLKSEQKFMFSFPFWSECVWKPNTKLGFQKSSEFRHSDFRHLMYLEKRERDTMNMLHKNKFLEEDSFIPHTKYFYPAKMKLFTIFGEVKKSYRTDTFLRGSTLKLTFIF